MVNFENITISLLLYTFMIDVSIFQLRETAERGQQRQNRGKQSGRAYDRPVDIRHNC